MIQLLTRVALVLGLTAPDPRILHAIDSACGNDTACGVDGVIFANAESGFNEFPKPFSHDAKDGTSCGVFQLPCTFTRNRSLDEQAKQWAALRAWSLKVCAALPVEERLAALASGTCKRGRALSRERYAQALFAVQIAVQ